MSVEQDANLGLYHSWAYRESGWKPGMDANLKKLGAVVHLSTLAIQNDPPVSPSEGDRYIVGVGTGDWETYDDEIAVYIDDDWVYYEANEGWLCWNVDNTSLLVFTSGSWEVLFALT